MPKWLTSTCKILIVLLLPVTAFAADFSNVGIIPSNIWYSKFPFYADEQVKIYTALFNNSGYVLRGILAFYDGTTLLGKKSFYLTSSESLQEIYLPWQTIPGSHDISIKVEGAEASQDGKTFESITLKNTVTGEQKIIVNVDPEKDEIAKLQKQLASLSLAQTKAAASGKINEAIQAVKNVDIKKGLSAADDAIKIGIQKVAGIAADSAIEVKAHMDGKDLPALVGAATPASQTTTENPKTSETADPASQLTLPGALEVAWIYLQYLFFLLVSLIFSSKWIVYSVLGAALVLFGKWLNARRHHSY